MTVTEFPFSNWEGEYGSYAVRASSHPADNPDGAYLLEFEDGTWIVAYGSPLNGWVGGYPFGRSDTNHSDDPEGDARFFFDGYPEYLREREENK